MLRFNFLLIFALLKQYNFLDECKRSSYVEYKVWHEKTFDGWAFRKISLFFKQLLWTTILLMAYRIQRATILQHTLTAGRKA